MTKLATLTAAIIVLLGIFACDSPKSHDAERAALAQAIAVEFLRSGDILGLTAEADAKSKFIIDDTLLQASMLSKIDDVAKFRASFENAGAATCRAILEKISGATVESTGSSASSGPSSSTDFANAGDRALSSGSFKLIYAGRRYKVAIVLNAIGIGNPSERDGLLLLLSGNVSELD